MGSAAAAIRRRMPPPDVQYDPYSTWQPAFPVYTDGISTDDVDDAG
jgi:hypothetical protein